jgi:hypothetical protein
MNKEVMVSIRGDLYTIEVYDHKVKVFDEYTKALPWIPSFDTGWEAVAFANKGKVELI